MADITVTPAQVGLVFPKEAHIRSYIAAAAITKGNAVYITTTGTVNLADASAAGTGQFRGIALQTVGAGQAVDVLHRGEVYGFAISGLNADVRVFTSDTAGALGDAAGTVPATAGRVRCLADKAATKVLFIDVDWISQWA